MGNKLDLKKAIDNPSLVPSTTLDVIKASPFRNEFMVAEIDPECADGFKLGERYGVDPKMNIKCLVVQAKVDNETHYVAILLPIEYKFSSSTVKREFGARNVSFAPLDYVMSVSGMEFGSITPIGLPSNFHILVDEMVMENEYIIVGGGYKHSKLMAPIAALLQLDNVKVLSGLVSAK